MSRELKKYIIQSDKQEVMKVPQAIIIGLLNGTEVQLNIQGKVSFEESIDMLNTAQYELLKTFLGAIVAKGEDEKEFRKKIYDRAVLGFSLMIDKFHPEGKDDKYAGMTNEAVLKAQNALLKERVSKNKSKNKSN